MTFTTLGIIEPIVRALNQKGYTAPSPIQQQAIPAVLSGRDVMAAAQTGTGKTGAFLVPVLQKLAASRTPVKANSVKVLVLTPTRELAAQVHESARFYGQHLKLRYEVVFGGVKINPQMMRLRGGVDILIATPGRLLDLVGQNAIKLNQVEVLVLDEADRMLDMGFIHDIKKVLKLLPQQRQNLMFSATFSPEIRALTKGILHQPIEIDVSPRNSTVEKIKQVVYTVEKGHKVPLLCKLIKDQSWTQVLVFSRTKHGANKIVEKLEAAGISALAIHGNKSQPARTKALASFKQNLITVLVATDIAARGLDIAELPHVVNFDLPNVPEDYVHRIGRTGRAGRDGEACSLVSPEERTLLRDIQKLIKIEIPVIPNAGYTDLGPLPVVKAEPQGRAGAPKPQWRRR
jgi:ATP-dependent RNA helicase RhlE